MKILENSKNYFSDIQSDDLKNELFTEAKMLFPNFGKVEDST